MGERRPEASCAASASALRGCCSASTGAIIVAPRWLDSQSAAEVAAGELDWRSGGEW